MAEITSICRLQAPSISGGRENYIAIGLSQGDLWFYSAQSFIEARSSSNAHVTPMLKVNIVPMSWSEKAILKMVMDEGMLYVLFSAGFVTLDINALATISYNEAQRDDFDAKEKLKPVETAVASLDGAALGSCNDLIPLHRVNIGGAQCRRVVVATDYYVPLVATLKAPGHWEVRSVDSRRDSPMYRDVSPNSSALSLLAVQNEVFVGNTSGQVLKFSVQRASFDLAQVIRASPPGQCGLVSGLVSLVGGFMAILEEGVEEALAIHLFNVNASRSHGEALKVTFETAARLPKYPVPPVMASSAAIDTTHSDNLYLMTSKGLIMYRLPDQRDATVVVPGARLARHVHPLDECVGISVGLDLTVMAYRKDLAVEVMARQSGVKWLKVLG
ncbi:hypothetical protein J8273_1695 [Carpediemonas membranifera]|uniref:Uncharacterized protein n=1 Tax=Carpediemonas membranifera TaxID=201153 RepID=A0A8J6BB95_9EUKA|nr:hypothetical protein J8273_1695 [Carpediemonas membranifera]|eukprot:KAG9396677.1 hypothetical protein J8273_1695 [Carpediemonas membranifera]